MENSNLNLESLGEMLGVFICRGNGGDISFILVEFSKYFGLFMGFLEGRLELDFILKLK